MKNINHYRNKKRVSSPAKIIRKNTCCILSILLCLCFTGCNKARDINNKADNILAVSASPTIEPSHNTKTEENPVPIENETIETLPDIKTVDYSDCFDTVEGCAVFYNSGSGVYEMYNKELCEKRSSPCSTFKIISTLLGLESGMIESADSTMGYDGTIYPHNAWNNNLSLRDAFRESCIWYFRKIIDQIGQREIQNWLDQLQYGNCDISEWDGSGLNPLPQLNGFWLESSLKISPREQVDILEKIFDGRTNFSEKNIEVLKEVMLTQESGKVSVYGKTGTGNKGNGWFVGMFEKLDERYYFALHLTDEKKETSGAKAKEIALKIIDKYYAEK